MRGAGRTADTGRLWSYALILLTGIGVALRGPVLAVLAISAVLGVLAMRRLPGWAWATGALVLTVLTPALNRVGIVPDIVTFLHFAFVYAGLGAVLLRHPLWASRDAQRLTVALVGLMMAACLSAVLHRTEALRPLVTVSIWAEPFVLILLLILEPPARRDRRRLLFVFGALLVIQLPIAVVQLGTSGVGDAVKGTLSGPHDLGGFTVLSGLALLAWGQDRGPGVGLACTVAALPLLFLVPAVADAKQIILSLPAAALVLLLTTRRLTRKIMIAGACTGAVVLLLIAVPAGRTAAGFLGGARSGKFAKGAGTEVAVQQMRAEWTNIVFGLGPANGLSRAAFLTADQHALRSSAPLARFRLKPAELPAQGEAQAEAVAQGTSFNSSIASATGIFTDVGLIGACAYVWVLAAAVAPLVRRRSNWLARVALAGWGLSIPLALTSQWWEVPDFMIPLALLTGIAATEGES